jgi:DNA-binding transcriptional MerR regulator
MGGAAQSRRLLRSGELARLAGVSSDLLRHYERIGVLPKPARSRAGYRLYPSESLARVQLVRRALSFGFSLAELTRILGVRDRGGVPCHQARALGREKLADVNRRLRELRVLRAQLQRLLREWDRRLARTPRGRRANLLEALPEPAPLMAGRKSLRKRGPGLR